MPGPFDPQSLLVLKFRGRSIGVLRGGCWNYGNVIELAQGKFRSLQGVPARDIVLLAAIPGYPLTDEIELSREIWPTVRNVVHSVTIALDSELQTSTEGIPSASSLPVAHSLNLQQPPPSYSPPTHTPQRVLPQHSRNVIQTIRVTFPSHISSTPDPFEISEAGLLGKKISYVYQLIESMTGFSPSNSWLSFRGPELDHDLTLADYNVASGGSIVLARRSWPIAPPVELSPMARKPIIYLYPPCSLPSVTVELLLTPSWHLCAVYPPRQPTTPFGKSQPAQCLTWEVAAEPDGKLVNKRCGTEVSYLYWEAVAKSHLITPDGSRATTPTEDIQAFDPSRPSVNPGDSVLLHIDKIPNYLDVALKALALHIEARTSFITFWLPDLLKHEYIALRFLPQASYEKAAQLCISPKPDVVTRVFMLFRGVTKDDLPLWSQAAARASAENDAAFWSQAAARGSAENGARFWSQAAARASAESGATFWAQVVGVDAMRASDCKLFRVLEWGGMEVK